MVRGRTAVIEGYRSKCVFAEMERADARILKCRWFCDVQQMQVVGR